MNSDGYGFLGAFLSDDILVESPFDF